MFSSNQTHCWLTVNTEHYSHLLILLGILICFASNCFVYKKTSEQMLHIYDIKWKLNAVAFWFIGKISKPFRLM